MENRYDINGPKPQLVIERNVPINTTLSPTFT